MKEKIMLLSSTATVIWNAKIKKHYVDKGYTFTKMKEPFIVDVHDLTDGSSAEVILKCDYCGREYQIRWEVYRRIHRRSSIQKDCCKDCCEVKAADAVVKKYGGFQEMFASCNNQRVQTNLDRYGAVNVFASNEIKHKIIETNISKYGVPYTQQCSDVRIKTEQTCLEKYGVKNYVELFKGKFIKESSPVWKGGHGINGNERATYEYNQWRNNVFARDHYTCRRCGDCNGSGHYVELNAHHIKNWKDHKADRYNLDNGITLCSKCHTEFHSKYGKHNTSQAQLKEFLYLDKKVC